MKASHINKFNDGPDSSGDADKVSDSGSLHEEHPEQETSLQSHHTDGIDQSDDVEHDVKVCDICGDAGHEDRLAICCRCPDGAEHIYCMKEVKDKVPEGEWLCGECKLEEIKCRNQQKHVDTSEEKNQSSDSAVTKVSAKRRAEELGSSSSFNKRTYEIRGSNKNVDRGKVKSSYQFSSDPVDESSEGSRSPATRSRLQSLQGDLSKSTSFSFPNAKSTKLVDEIVLQRQKLTKELSSHDTVAAKEISKSSFRSKNLGRLGASISKVQMLSPNSAHVQDLKIPVNKKDTRFERALSRSTSDSAALTPKGDKLLSSRGESNPVSSGSNSEGKPSKADSKGISGLKSSSRLLNSGAEASVSQGQIDKQPSSPTKVGTSSSGTINSVKHKSVDTSSKATSKETTNLADVSKENTMGLHPGPPGVSCQNNKQTAPSAQGSCGDNASTIKTSKDMKNGDNKLKDAIEAALLKKPGIYRKSKVPDQANESSALATNKDAAIVGRVPHSRNAGSSTSADVASRDWHGQITQTSIVDYSKQSNGNNADVALSSVLKRSAVPDHECIWQGSFEIKRSGKTAGFLDGLQAHLSTCASPRVFEAVNKFPQKILLNGVSRVSAWPTQFKASGVKEDNIALYFFAKDLESYEKSYLILLDDMIKGDLALIGSIDGVELLIFPSSQLPEKSNRWNMLFFLWGVFRGKKKNSSHQIANNPGKSYAPSQSFSSITADKILTENASLMGSIEKDKHADPESKVNSKLQNPSQEKGIDSVNAVPASSKETIPESRTSNEPKKRPFIDLTKYVDFEGTSQTNKWHDVSGRTTEEENSNKKQKIDLNGQNNNLDTEKSNAGNSNGERYFFPVDRGKTQQKPVFALDLNEDITYLAGDDDNFTTAKKDDGDNPASLSLSLAFSLQDGAGKG